jgi:hypothetical protein
MRYIYCCLLLLVFALGCRINSGDMKDTMAKVVEIDTTLKKYTYLSFEGTPDPERSKIRTYYEKDNPILIISEYFGDSGRVINRYYFNENEMIFVYREDYIYNRPIYYNEEMAKAAGDNEWYDDSKSIRLTNRFFFFDSKLDKWFDYDNKEVPKTDPRFKKKQTEIAGAAVLYLKMRKIAAKDNR